MVNPSTATVVIYDKVSQTRTVGFDLLNKDSIDPKLVIDEATIDTDLVVIKGAEYKLKKVVCFNSILLLFSILFLAIFFVLWYNLKHFVLLERRKINERYI